MSPRRPLPGGAALPLMHWLVLLCGLSAITVLRIDQVDKTLPLWIGGVLGTALGQLFAWSRLRPWMATFLAVNAIWVGAIVLWPLLVGVRDAGSVLQAYGPAVLCGYLSMTERGTLAAFWFPAVLWTLAILHVDPKRGAALGSTASWLLLSGLGMLFVGTLWARETRRVTQWRTQATVSLAEPAGRAVLREAPLRGVARLGWMLGLGAAMVVVTAWISPHLRQSETFTSAASKPGGAGHVASTGGAAGTAAPSPRCCPEVHVTKVKSERVREYFPLVEPHDVVETWEPLPTACVPCRNGVPIETVASGPSALEGTPGTGGVASTEAPPAAGGVAAAQPIAAAPVPPPVQPPAPQPAPVEVKPQLSAPPPPVAATRPSDPPKPAERPAVAPVSPAPVAVAGVVAPPPPPRAPVAAAPQESHLLEWLLALALSALAIHLALQPLRRWITLRHLHRPFWTESVDQRVSNLWQLMLVGLRDAGWRSVPGEQPQELARRVGVDGMKTCATVLERARHGVRVDAADLEAMESAARSAYGAARGRVGWLARAAAWWRWPLV